MVNLKLIRLEKENKKLLKEVGRLSEQTMSLRKTIEEEKEYLQKIESLKKHNLALSHEIGTLSGEVSNLISQLT